MLRWMTLNEKGALTFNFDGNEVVLTEDDLLIDMAQTEGYVSEADNTVTVVLDTTLTPELLEEGFVPRDRQQDPDYA